MSSPLHQTVVVTDIDDVNEKLARLDLSVDVFHEAAKMGEEETLLINSMYPKTAKGLTRWMKTVAVAREQLTVTGDKWEADDPENRPILKSVSCKQRILAFSSGTSETGLSDKNPNVARKKGPATTQLVIDLGELIPINSQNQWDGQWFFLYYRASDEIRMEVSLPVEFRDGVVHDWKHRIILPSLKVATISAPINNDYSGTTIEDENYGIDFVLEPRNS